MDLPSLAVSITGPGNPIWTGLPSHARVSAILALTYTDQYGRRYYRIEPGGALRKMWIGKYCYNETAEAFRQLNAAIDR